MEFPLIAKCIGSVDSLYDSESIAQVVGQCLFSGRRDRGVSNTW